MEKIRVYELAKELNTSSKRVMEKLEEIGVKVKNHMSLLEDNELKAFYGHIGLKKDEHKADEPTSNNGHKESTADKSTHPKEEEAHKHDPSKKSGVRIVRKVEINLDARSDTGSIRQDKSNFNNDYKNKGSYKNSKPSGRNDYSSFTSSGNSGLRPGYIRDKNGQGSMAAARQAAQFSNQVKPVQTPPVKPAAQNSAAVHHDAVKQDTVNEVKTPSENKSAIAPEIKTAPEKAALPIKEVITENEKKTAMHPKKKPQPEEQGAVVTVESAGTDDKSAKDVNTVNTENNQIIVDRSNTNTGNEAGSSAAVRKPADFRENKTKDTFIKKDSVIPNVPQGKSGYRDGHRDGQGKFSGNRYNSYNKDGAQNNYNKDNRTQGRPPYNKEGGAAPYNKDARQPGSNYQGRQQGTGGFQNRPNKDFRQGASGTYGNAGRQGQGTSYGNRPPYNKDVDNTYGKDREFRPSYGSDRNRSSQSGASSDLPSANVLIGKEQRKDYANKKLDKVNTNNDKKDSSRPQATHNKTKKFTEPSATKIVGQKKGVNEVLDEEFILDEFYNDSQPRNKRLQKPKKTDRQQKAKYIPPKAVLTSITVGDTITVKELAELLKKTSTDVIKRLMLMGVMATLNQVLDYDTASLIADEFGIKTEKAIIINDEDILFDDSEDEPENLKTRPPVVVVMGHVDHGKTSLLDAIRETKAALGEAGGITQHIGAYVAKINGRNITFLDTPGHEAFTAMRLRGAQATDIAIIVVAADDGVMPQTIEAINHAKAANVSIIVAINKIDKPNINIDRVKQELSEHDVLVEDWGGDVICVPVSAKKRENIDTLLEMVLLTADILELKADYEKQSKGIVIEAKLDKSRGALATVLVQRGTLRVGDSIVSGTTVGRIRAMNDYKGKSIKEAGPSTPVEIIGLAEVPDAGEIFYAIKDERIAKHLIEDRKSKQRDEMLKPSAGVKLEDLFSHIQEGKLKDLNLIIKADVQGSVEAIKQSMLKLVNEEVRVRVIHDAVGAITESDISLAQVSGAIIIGFNVRPGFGVAEAAENAGVDLRLYRVIYDAIDDVKAAMNGMLTPTFKEVVLGHIEIRQIFKVSGVGTIGGAYVLDGKVQRNSNIRVVRDGIVIHDGKLASLKRFKDDVKEVAEGFECGVNVEKFNDIKDGDIIEAYAMEEVKR